MSANEVQVKRLESPDLCPYPHCTGAPGPTAARCQICDRKLILCTNCRSVNRSMATYCRRCGKLLPETAELRLVRGNPGQTGFLSTGAAYPGGQRQAGTIRRHRMGATVDAGVVTAFDLLFVPTYEDGLHILRLKDMSTLAVIPAPGDAPLMHAPAVAHGNLYLVSPTGLDVYDLKRQAWHDRGGTPPLLTSCRVAEENIVTAPLPVAGTVVVGTDRGLWKLDVGGNRLVRLAGGRSDALVAHNGLLVHSPDDETLVGLDLSGQLRWTHQPTSSTLGPRRVQSAAGILSNGDTLLFADQAGIIWRFYPESGGMSRVAQREFGVITGLAASPDGDIALGSHVGLTILQAGYPFRSLEQPIEAPPVITPNLVLAGTSTGSLLIVDRVKGDHEPHLVGSGPIRGLAVSGTQVIAVTREGGITIIDLSPEGGR